MTVNSPIDVTLREIAQAYRHGALVWMKRNRPKEWEKMIALERDINEMALKGDLKGLKKVLMGYQGLILGMMKTFEASEGRKI
jgi:hypothetical protein